MSEDPQQCDDSFDRKLQRQQSLYAASHSQSIFRRRSSTTNGFAMGRELSRRFSKAESNNNIDNEEIESKTVILTDDDTEELKNERKWVCFDDGTGKNVYYENISDKTRSRIAPPNFIPEVFCNGDRKYYFRGNCIRCRKKEFPSVISMKRYTILYSLNICNKCILDTVPTIHCLKGNGDQIWEAHGHSTPKNMYMELDKVITDTNREDHITLRAQHARHEVRLEAKNHRDLERWGLLKGIAYQHGIVSGNYVSWGLGNRFDEYFGEVTSNDIPHGLGIKIYSDKSIYVGEWKDGNRHTINKPALWTRPDGYEYEGQFLSDMKHGYGEIKYPDGTTYKGEFARDLEHGNGKMVYNTDGSHFEGKFRFGKRDGPGTLVHHDGTTTKMVFRDYILFYTEKPLAQILNKDDDDETDFIPFQPDSLLHKCNQSLTSLIKSGKAFVSSTWIRERFPEYLKSIFAVYYLSSLLPIPSSKYINAVNSIAFKYIEQVSINHVHLTVEDIETFIFFQSSNIKLESLALIGNKLEGNSINSICTKISSDSWLNLQSLDLSYNFLTVSAIKLILQTCRDRYSIKDLRLSGCQVSNDGAIAIAEALIQDNHISNLELAYNVIQDKGAKALAEALKRNKSLTSLNLRQNRINQDGGKALANMLKTNKTLTVLCILDNLMDTDVVSAIAGRLSGSLEDVKRSARSQCLSIPKRFSYIADEDFLGIGKTLNVQESIS